MSVVCWLKAQAMRDLRLNSMSPRCFFILFDIEVIFLMPWVLVFREFLAANLPILLPIFFFIFVMVFGLFYELKKGAIEWEK